MNRQGNDAVSMVLEKESGWLLKKHSYKMAEVAVGLHELKHVKFVFKRFIRCFLPQQMLVLWAAKEVAAQSSEEGCRAMLKCRAKILADGP